MIRTALSTVVALAAGANAQVGSHYKFHALHDRVLVRFEVNEIAIKTPYFSLIKSSFGFHFQ